MDARTFYDLEAGREPHQWELPVVPNLCTPGGFLFGGCGLGACITAMELTTDRPLIWATAQFLSYANPPSTMDVEVTVASDGRNLTQARAVGRVGGREILTVNGALGRRDFPHEGEWSTRPDVPRPEDCPARESPFDPSNTIHERLVQRIASGGDHPDGTGPGSPDGRCAIWTRLPEFLETSPAALSILGDYVPMGIRVALGESTTSNSLDNTLRVARLVPTDWVLADIRVHAVAAGIGHGTVHLWSEDGTLLATASQSAIVRHRRF